jgi:hypothetical protein
MRAKEFIVEVTKGNITKRQQQSTRGLNIFAKSPTTFDRQYDLNRVMMAVACSDGVTPFEMDSESWSGKMNTAHPYTKEEQDMLTMAYKVAGIAHVDLNKGDMRSQEVGGTNKQSPVKAFKGYKK